MQISTLSCCDFGLLVWICEIKAQILHRTRKIATLTGQKVVRDNLMCNFCTCTVQISLRTKNAASYEFTCWMHYYFTVIYLIFNTKDFFLLEHHGKWRYWKYQQCPFKETTLFGMKNYTTANYTVTVNTRW